MTKLIKSMLSNLSVAGELLSYLRRRRLWWLIPMVVGLLAFGILMVFATSSGVGPFIYTLF
jgi:hypothetical protein